MIDFYVNALKTLINKLYTQDNYNDLALIEEIKSIGLDNVLLAKYKNMKLEDYLLDPFILQFTRNESVYNTFIYPISKISINKYIEKIEEEDFETFIIENINNMYADSRVFKEMLTLYTDEIKTDEELSYMFNKAKMKTSLLMRKKDPEELRTYINAIVKLRSRELGLHVTSKILTLEEYIDYSMENNNFLLQKTNTYKKITGLATTTNKVLINLDHFNDIYLKMINPKYFYIEIERVINHELYHIIQNNREIINDKFVSEEMYEYVKNCLIRSKDEDFYLKYHDYFELEIEANIYSYAKLLKENDSEKIENLLKNEKLKRCTKTYDMINDRFDMLLLTYNNLTENPIFKYEYDVASLKTLKELITSKRVFLEDLDLELENNTTEEIVMYKREKLDNDFINSIIFNGIFKMAKEHISLNIEPLDEQDLLILKEALIYGKLKYLNKLNTVLENRTDNFKDKFNNIEPKEYIKNSINKIDEINQIVDRKINNTRRR